MKLKSFFNVGVSAYASGQMTIQNFFLRSHMKIGNSDLWRYAEITRPSRDEFKFKITGFGKSKKISKRQLPSSIATIYAAVIYTRLVWAD